MTHDEWLAAATVASFAVLVTVHVALVAGLLGRRPRWRAAVAAVAAPLAPFWGFRAGMPVRSGLWIAAALAYLLALRSALR
ncbi:MAG TPA: hypothetical protein VHV30_02205 [Polyangiaceae bacterium]|jgi:hypothetical protein|nr:hypothetical protein [Polyangiaceae bacterium]